MSRWVVEVLALPERLTITEEPFATQDEARDFVAQVMADWECACAIHDRTGEMPSRRFEREAARDDFDGSD